MNYTKVNIIFLINRLGCHRINSNRIMMRSGLWRGHVSFLSVNTHRNNKQKHVKIHIHGLQKPAYLFIIIVLRDGIISVSFVPTTYTWN